MVFSRRDLFKLLGLGVFDVSTKRFHLNIGKHKILQVDRTNSRGLDDNDTETKVGGPSTFQKRIAVYNSGNNPRLSISGTKLNLGTGYLAMNQRISGASGEMAAWNAGSCLIITIDSKTVPGPTWLPWSDTSAGLNDADLLGIRSDCVDLLNQTGRSNQWIALSFVHEGAIRISGTNRLAVDTASTYVPSANYFADFMHASNHPRLFTIHWVASSPNASFLPAKSKHDMLSADPYKVGDHPVAETATGTWQPAMNSFTNNGWTTQRRFITETGIKTDLFSNGGQFTEQQQLDWYATWPQAFIDTKIEGAVWFEAQGRNHDFRPQYSSIEPEFALEANQIING